MDNKVDNKVININNVPPRYKNKDDENDPPNCSHVRGVSIWSNCYKAGDVVEKYNLIIMKCNFCNKEYDYKIGHNCLRDDNHIYKGYDHCKICNSMQHTVNPKIEPIKCYHDRNKYDCYMCN